MIQSQTGLDFFFDSLGDCPALPEEAVVELARVIRTWQDSPNPSELEKKRGQRCLDSLVRHNRRLVVHIWKKHYRTVLPVKHRGILDAFQLAQVYLIRAGEKFDPKKGNTFSTYATPWIIKGFNEYIMVEDRYIRLPLNNLYLIKAARAMIQEAYQKGQSIPSCDEMCAILAETRRNVPTPETLKELLVIESITNCTPLDFNSHNIDNERRFKSPASHSILNNVAECDDYSLEDSEDLDLVMSQMDYLSDLERSVIERRFIGDSEKLEDIAADMNLSRTRIHQIQKRAVGVLSEAIRVNFRAA